MAATNSISGTIDGNSISTYVRQLTRQENVCNPGQHADLMLDTKFPFAVSPGNAVVLNENGTKVLTGWVVGSSRNRPAYDWIVRIDDNMTRVVNTFLEDTLSTTTIRTVSSLIGEILDQCGVTYNFTAPDANVPPSIEIGLRSAWDAIQELLAYASWYLRFDANGVAQIGRVTDGGSDHTLTSFLSFAQNRGDATTRNVIKVYGSSAVGPVGGRIFTSASRSIPDIIPDRVAAIGNPMIETQPEADRVARYLLEELGSVTDIKEITIPGDPTIRIGDKARLIHDSDGFGYSATGVITTMESTLEEGGGYTMDAVVDERCPRIAGWSKYTPPIYAGTGGDGVYRSTDDGVTWVEYNTGLPAGNKYVKRVSANTFDELMSIVNDVLYYHNGEQWHSITLPVPTNTAGDSPAPTGATPVAVDNTFLSGEFYVLGRNMNDSDDDTQQVRSWIYHTENSGSDWTSVQLQTSGSGFHCVALDLVSRFGDPYAIASSGSLYILVPTDADCPNEWHVGDLTRYGTRGLSEKCAEATQSWGEVVVDEQIGVVGWYPSHIFQFFSVAEDSEVVRFNFWVKFYVKLSPTTDTTAIIEARGDVSSGGIASGPFANPTFFRQYEFTYGAEAGGGYKLRVERITVDKPAGGTNPIKETDFGSIIGLRLAFVYRQSGPSADRPLYSLVGTGTGLTTASCDDGVSTDAFRLLNRSNFTCDAAFVFYQFC